MRDVFSGSDVPVPKPFDPLRAERTLAELSPAIGHIDLRSRTHAVLAATFGNSPYLARLALREQAFLPELLGEEPQRVFDRVLAKLCVAHERATETEVMAVLRQAKRRVALLVALADIGGLWPLEEVTGALSRFADAAVGSALRFLLRQAAQSVQASMRDPLRLEAETGVVVLAMGKYGAFELNYSSDIDLIIFYDAERFPFRKKSEQRSAAVDLAKGLVKLISEVTADGYVFRVDLRLRPDAGATQIAISTAAAEDYYEAMGQNWERAALIKARPCAGDKDAAARFIKAIEPFIWRRNLDFAAIEDIHSIKRQIHAHEGHGAIAIAGHNIKLGRGGIREIEFFAQTQQLILGGRNPALRAAGTVAALEALCAYGHVEVQVAADLRKAYRFLRTLEHRLQMVEDEQTHTLPKSADGLRHIAGFMGFDDEAAFGTALRAELETVQDHYARLFERSAPLSGAKGNLVFTGVEDDPETIDTLRRLGFRDPRHVAAAIRGWHHGRIRATRSPRARELLTKLMPALLEALAATADPDAAFAQFDLFLSRLPAGVQLFSLFFANPHLLERIAMIAGSAPRLADHMARAPATIDALLDAEFLTRLPARHELDRMLSQSLAAAGNFEAALDAARRFAREQIFRVGVQVIEGRVQTDAAGPAFAEIAESVIAALLLTVEREQVLSVGTVPGGSFAVIAMGKLGGREMTAASDLDLILVYDAPEGVEASIGAKPIPLITYYARLAQRFITALTVATAEGTLYEVDMRLRPTGSMGPVAVSLQSFVRYHETQAWTWERLALTRARVVAGPKSLERKIAAIVRAALVSGRKRGDVRKDARDMREKLAAQFPGKSRWDLKFAPGGLVDIEFIAQALELEWAAQRAHVLQTNTIAALRALEEAGALSADDAATLIAAAGLEQSLTQVLKIAVEGAFDPRTATAGLKNLLVRAGGVADFDVLDNTLMRAQHAARRIFDRVFG